MSDTVQAIQPQRVKGADLEVHIARTDDEIRATQALRYRVFAQEMGAEVHGGDEGLDKDDFDPYCQHLIVRDKRNGRIVACTRALTSAAAERCGSYYSETEFNIERVLKPGLRYLEIGRTCVDPAYRGGAIMAVLWSGLARLMLETDSDFLMGCVSIPMDDGGSNALAIMDSVRDEHMSEDALRVFPKRPLPHHALHKATQAEMPSLLKAYLRAGVHVCGDACWDPDFNVADLFVLLPKARISDRYRRHFLEQDQPLAQAV